MSQPTSIQLLDNAIWTNSARSTMTMLNSRPFTVLSARSFHEWLLARSDYPKDGSE
jgi:hypothetical protein